MGVETRMGINFHTIRTCARQISNSSVSLAFWVFQKHVLESDSECGNGQSRSQKMFRKKIWREEKISSAYEAAFCASYSDVYLHNISFMCFARYLTKMLRSFRVCVNFFLPSKKRWDHIFSEGNVFCLVILCSYSTFGFRSLSRVCDKALCFFYVRESESRREKIFRSIITDSECVWVSGFRVWTRWKCDHCVGENRHLLFSLDHRKI